MGVSAAGSSATVIPTTAAPSRRLFEPTEELLNVLEPLRGDPNRLIDLVKNHYQPLHNQLQPNQLDNHFGLFELCKRLGANREQIKDVAQFLLVEGEHLPEGSPVLESRPNNDSLVLWVNRNLVVKIDALRQSSPVFNQAWLSYTSELFHDFLLAPPPANLAAEPNTDCPINLLKALVEIQDNLERVQVGDNGLDDNNWSLFQRGFSDKLDRAPAANGRIDQINSDLDQVSQRTVQRLKFICSGVADTEQTTFLEVFNQLPEDQLALLIGQTTASAHVPNTLKGRQDQIVKLVAALDHFVKRFAEHIARLPEGEAKTALMNTHQPKLRDLNQGLTALVQKLPDYISRRVTLPSPWIQERPAPTAPPAERQRFNHLDQARTHWAGTFADLGVAFETFTAQRPSKPVDYLETLDNTQVISWAENLLKQPTAQLASAKVEMVLEALALKGLLLARKVHGPHNVASHHKTLVDYQNRLIHLLERVSNTIDSAGEALLNQPAFEYTDPNVLGAKAQSTLSDGLLKMMSNDFKSSVRGQRECPTFKVILENLLSTKPGSAERSILGDLSLKTDAHTLTDPIHRLNDDKPNLTDEGVRLDWSKRFLKSAFEGVTNYKGTIAPKAGVSGSADAISELLKTEFKSLSGKQGAVFHHALTEVSFAQDTPDHLLESLTQSALIADGFDLNDVYFTQAPTALKCRSFKEKAKDDKRSMFALTRQKTLDKQANFVGTDLSDSFRDRLNKTVNGSSYFETQLNAVLNDQHSDHIGVRKLVHQLIVAIPRDVRRARFQEVSALLNVANQLGTGNWGDYAQRKGDLKSVIMGLYRGTLATLPLTDAVQSAKQKCSGVFTAQIKQLCADRHDLSAGLKLGSSKNKALQAEFELNRESMALRFYQTGFPILDEQKRESYISMADLLAEAGQPARWPIMFHKLLLPATRVELEGGKAIEVGDGTLLSAAFMQIDEKTGTKPELNAELKAMALAHALADGICGQIKRPLSTDKDLDNNRVKTFGIQFDNQKTLVNSPAAHTPLLRAVQATLQWANDAVKRSFSSHPSTKRGYELEPDEVLLKAIDPHGLSKPLGLYKLAEESLKAAEAAAAVGAPALVIRSEGAGEEPETTPHAAPSDASNTDEESDSHSGDSTPTAARAVPATTHIAAAGASTGHSEIQPAASVPAPQRTAALTRQDVSGLLGVNYKTNAINRQAASHQRRVKTSLGRGASRMKALRTGPMATSVGAGGGGALQQLPITSEISHAARTPQLPGSSTLEMGAPWVQTAVLGPQNHSGLGGDVWGDQAVGPQLPFTVAPASTEGLDMRLAFSSLGDTASVAPLYSPMLPPLASQVGGVFNPALSTLELAQGGVGMTSVPSATSMRPMSESTPPRLVSQSGELGGLRKVNQLKQKANKAD